MDPHEANFDGVIIGPTEKRVFVCINGILSAPGDSDGWTDRAVTWLQTNTPYKAEKWEYVTGPILRRLKQQGRAEKIATMLRYYECVGYEIVLVGHSNGCDLIARVLALRAEADWYFEKPIRSAHLFAAAADAGDFLDAMDLGSLQALHLYGSSKDWALKFAKVSRTLFGWAGLGYGSLGLEGDIFESDDLGWQLDAGRGKRVFDHGNDTFGHSDWFKRGRAFEASMLSLMHHDNSHPCTPTAAPSSLSQVSPSSRSPA